MKQTINKNMVITKEDVDVSMGFVNHFHFMGEWGRFEDSLKLMEKLKHHLKKQIGKEEFEKYMRSES